MAGARPSDPAFTGRIVTGERAVTGRAGFNPSWQRHVFAYAQAPRFLGPGRVLDLGCGTGHSFELLAPRESVGVDRDARSLAGQQRATVVADMRALPFADRSFDSITCMHAVEHVPDADAVLAEAARVLRDDGTAIFVTPNRLTFGSPDEIIDPYHYREYDPRELVQLLERFFADVQLHGVFGSPRHLALVDAEHARLGRLLARDPLRLRRLVPRRLRQVLYDVMLTRARRRATPQAAAIDQSDFHLGAEDLAQALDLFAVVSGPRRRTR
jgi:SAM-dependent methyltransferase